MISSHTLLIDSQIVLWTYLTYYLYACLGLLLGIALYLMWKE